VTLTLVDGGMGDDDGVANGNIEDPSGLGFLSSTLAPSGSNEFGGGGGSSCFIDASGANVMTIQQASLAVKALGTVLVALIVFLVMDRQRHKEAEEGDCAP